MLNLTPRCTAVSALPARVGRTLNMPRFAMSLRLEAAVNHRGCFRFFGADGIGVGEADRPIDVNQRQIGGISRKPAGARTVKVITHKASDEPKRRVPDIHQLKADFGKSAGRNAVVPPSGTVAGRSKVIV